MKCLSCLSFQYYEYHDEKPYCLKHHGVTKHNEKKDCAEYEPVQIYIDECEKDLKHLYKENTLLRNMLQRIIDRNTKSEYERKSIFKGIRE